MHAAVPTYVVEFELNTKFERSLERFMFDLFNTLQRRDEDFTAAFELQKIEKAMSSAHTLLDKLKKQLSDSNIYQLENKSQLQELLKQQILE